MLDNFFAQGYSKERVIGVLKILDRYFPPGNRFALFSCGPRMYYYF